MIAQPSDLPPIQPVLLQAIEIKVRSLPPEHQQQVLDFVEFLTHKTQSQESGKSLWDVLDEAAASIPPEEREEMPTDGSYQHDHYLCNTPKRAVRRFLTYGGMEMTIEQVWVEKLRSLPPDRQQEALNFVEFLQAKQDSSSGVTRWAGVSALEAARSVMGEVGDAPSDLSNKFE